PFQGGGPRHGTVRGRKGFLWRTEPPPVTAHLDGPVVPLGHGFCSGWVVRSRAQSGLTSVDSLRRGHLRNVYDVYDVCAGTRARLNQKGGRLVFSFPCRRKGCAVGQQPAVEPTVSTCG